MDTFDKRRIIGTLSPARFNDPGQGKVRCHFEIFGSNDIAVIGTRVEFCNTEHVFITSGYNELADKFEGRLFEVEVVKSSWPVKEGGCNYVATAKYCSELRGTLISDVIEYELPNPNKPIIYSYYKPYTRSLFIKHQNAHYGPFNFDISEVLPRDFDSKLYKIELIAPVNGCQGFTGAATSTFSVAKIQSTKLSAMETHFYDDNLQVSLVGPTKLAIQLRDSEFEFLSDEQIISTYGQKLAANPNIRGFTKGLVQEVKRDYQKYKEYQENPERYQRCFHLLDQAALWNEIRHELFNEFFNSSVGIQVSEAYLEKNQDKFYAKIKQEYVETINIELTHKHNEIKELNQQLDNLRAEIRAEKLRLQDIQTQTPIEPIIVKYDDTIEAKIKEKQDELINIETELNSLKKSYTHYQHLDHLFHKQQELQADCDSLMRWKERLNHEVDNISDKLKVSNEKLIRRMMDIKPEVDALCGLKSQSVTPVYNYALLGTRSSFENHLSDARDDYIREIMQSLTDFQRKLDYYTVANLLITLAQTQFTVFSGLPGTGKTSTAKLLGLAMGLGNRFISIPVARGWTSQRDILGFYNALSQNFQPAATGLYDLLKQVHQEEIDSAPAIVLLDEFNVSQPEYYFSSFMEMADPESTRTIITGAPNEQPLFIPEYVRFLGTINQDDTVQILSPRMLDRVAVIHFDEPLQFETLQTDIELNYENKTVQTIKGNDFIQLFKPKHLSLAEDISNMLNLITTTLANSDPKLGAKVVISYRKLKAIAAYCNVAGPMMIEDRYAALDYAVSQHILPLLSGYGESFGKRLSLLKNQLPSSMEKSHAKLELLILQGEINLYSFGRMHND
ncbi:MAG: hypothetical protein RL637_604 [Pseudomonadota bacterium]